MSHVDLSIKRQLWAPPTETSATWSRHCTPFVLPSNGVLALKDSTITLTTNVVFTPECTGTGIQDVSSIADLKQPFYSSTIPQTYVIAAATVIAWILVIMLLITPRTNFFGHSGAAPAFTNGRGIIGGATGGSTNLTGGSRPWLQKVAAFTVAISLTIATADTFEAAEAQYAFGYMNADALRRAVLQSLEIRITRVISDIFLWLAQVQTLIRLFPRHKEKVLIKWIGFALILFDSLFSCLNSFLVNTTHSPRQFADAIPALSYLFELALSLLYAAWVIYYSLTKRRYAYYHSKMRSIILIAFLSLVAVLTPVVFFVTDVSNPDVAGWGDYFRWVGAAAASVVVWEWVERIEALERDEKKDGILGREIFDGDEMLDVIPSDDVVWNPSRSGRGYYKGNEKDDDSSRGPGNESSAVEKGFGDMARRFKPRQRKMRQHFPLGRAHSNTTTATPDPASNGTQNRRTDIAFGHLPKPRDQNEVILGGPTPPPAVASPISRADTTSAASTVYVVQHNPLADVPLPVRRRVDANGNTERAIAQAQAQRNSIYADQQNKIQNPEKEEVDEVVKANRARGQGAWYSVSNPFKRKRASPPAEVRQAQTSGTAPRAATPAHNFSHWDFKHRMGVLAAETGEKIRDKRSARRQHSEGPVTIIPAQPRGSGRTWSPPTGNEDDNAEASTGAESNDSSPSQGASGSTTLTANSNPAPTSSHSQPEASREEHRSPLGAGGTITPTVVSSPSRASNSQPPRASDLSPARGSTSPVVVPAPKRSMRSSPLATFHTSVSESSGSRDRADSVSHDHG